MLWRYLADDDECLGEGEDGGRGGQYTSYGQGRVVNKRAVAKVYGGNLATDDKVHTTVTLLHTYSDTDTVCSKTQRQFAARCRNS